MAKEWLLTKKLSKLYWTNWMGNAVPKNSKYVKLFGKHLYNQELWEVGIAYTRVAKNFNLTLNLTGQKTCRPFTKLNSRNPFDTSATSCTIITFQDLGDRIKGMLMMDLLES